MTTETKLHAEILANDDCCQQCGAHGSTLTPGEQIMAWVQPNPARTGNEMKLWVHAACWDAYQRKH